MEFVKIPNVDLKASRVALGTWSIGGWLWGGPDDEASRKTIHLALDSGINFIDTAPLYGFGHAEELLGRVLKERKNRDKVILATKAGVDFFSQQGKLIADSRKETIIKEFEASLQRLKVEYIDIYQIHWSDPKTPLAETAEILQKLKDSGKIKAVGVCNYVVDQLEDYRRHTPLETSQFPFNIFERDFESAVLPYCRKQKIITLGYGPLCRGILSDQFKNKPFMGDDVRNFDPKYQEPSISDYIQCAESLSAWAKNKYQKSLFALALRWCLDKGIDIALLGARKPHHLKNLDSVWNWKLTSEDFTEIDSIIAREIKHPAKAFFAIGERPPGLLDRT